MSRPTLPRTHSRIASPQHRRESRPRRTCKALLWSGALSASGVLGACGTTAPGETGYAQARVEGGDVDAKSTQVFRVLARVTGFNELCSATLIAPQLMLTARHCVAPTPGGSVNCETDHFGATVAPSELKFANDVEPDLFSRWFDAAEVLVSPDSDLTCGYDIALVILTEPVPPEVAVPAEPRFLPKIQSGETYSAVGYGGSDANEDVAEYGIRHSRAGLSVMCGQNNNCADNTVAAQEFLGSEGACHGDSGGPAIDDDGQVIGVLSRGAEGCASPIYVGVPAFEALLVDAATRANTAWNAPLPVWAGGEPTPVATTPAGSTSPPDTTSEPDADTEDEGTADEDEDDSAAEDDTRAEPTLSKEGCSVVEPGAHGTAAWAAGLACVALGLTRRRWASRLS